MRRRTGRWITDAAALANAAALRGAEADGVSICAPFARRGAGVCFSRATRLAPERSGRPRGQENREVRRADDAAVIQIRR